MAKRINPNLKHLVESRKAGNKGAVLVGSSRSGKTWSGIDFIIYISTVIKEPCTINVVRDTYNSFKTTLYDDFNRRLPMFGIKSPFADVKEVSTFWLFKTKVNLIGGDKPSKFLGAGCDYLFINEAIPNVEKKLFDQAEMRCRKFWWIDSNPSASDHWALELKQRDDVSYLKTTFRDNPMISKNERDKILSYDPENPENIRQGTADPYMWKVYGLGMEAEREGLILRNWEIGEFDESLPFVYGMDFGYVNDPTTLVRCAFDKKRRILYVEELLYKPGLSTDQIAEELKVIIKGRDLIIADSAEPRLIDELYNDHKFNIHPAKKGPDSIRLGLSKLANVKIVVTEESYNLHKELKNYIWNEKKANIPIDEWNHCFTGDTLISTDSGEIQIDKLNPDDLALTTKGYKRIINRFHNGEKQVCKYLMHFDTFSVSLECTPDHKIKTGNTWTEIQKLKKGDRIYLHKFFEGKPITYTKGKNISAKEGKDYTGLFGSFLKAKYRKIIMYIISIVIRMITVSKIYRSFTSPYIFDILEKRDLRIIQSGQKNFTQRELRLLKIGIEAKREENGTSNTVKTVGLIDLIERLIAKFAEKSIKLSTQEYLSTAIKTARLKHLELVESRKEKVYDLMIEDQHEYFANGVLVHNCIDSLRYAMEELEQKRGFFIG